MAQTKPTIQPINQSRPYQVSEFRLSGIPSTTNPFDPDLLAVDATVTDPAGNKRTVPAFWYQAYQRSLEGNKEVLKAVGQAHWRLRFTPETAGKYRVTLALTKEGKPVPATGTATFMVQPERKPPTGFVRIAKDKRSFTLAPGGALPLIGANYCWHGDRGTYDYTDWFPNMSKSGMNFARVWMCPWAFGIEAGADTLNRYRLDRAWQLDQTFDLAEAQGIYLMLCLDYHGMFETKPDFWNTNDNWKINPYNSKNGGPCATQNDFFTSPEAKRIYQKRLRYLIARYGASRRLLAWEFFNEIDNVFAYLKPLSVRAWHEEMGRWLRTKDPYRHLITTSYSGGGDQADLWTLPELEITQAHSYGQSHPTAQFPELAARYTGKYDKPFLIGEYGVDYRGWYREQADPHLRGLRQGIWAGMLSSSAGTAMSWWWENLYKEKVTPLYRVIRDHRDWFDRQRGTAMARPIKVRDAAAEVTGRTQETTPFSVTLTPGKEWGGRVPGTLAVANLESAALAGPRLNGFVHGSNHKELLSPFVLSTYLSEGARLVLHLNSVSNGAVMAVKVDGQTVFTRALPDKDGKTTLEKEYDEDIVVPLPSGKHRIEVLNTGNDWYFLDSARIENALPAISPVMPTIAGLVAGKVGLLYVVHPMTDYPANAKVAAVAPLQNAIVEAEGVPSGRYRAEWYRPTDGMKIGATEGQSINGVLRLAVPSLADDLVCRLTASGR